MSVSEREREERESERKREGFANTNNNNLWNYLLYSGRGGVVPSYFHTMYGVLFLISGGGGGSGGDGVSDVKVN